MTKKARDTKAGKQALEQSRVVLARNNRCPFCGAKDTEGHSVDTGEGFAHQGMNCLDCDKNWIEKYTLIEVIEND